MVGIIVHKLGFIIRFILSVIPAKSSCSVITLHNIKPADYSWLCCVLDFIKKNYGFIDTLDGLKNSNNSKKVLLTFDDGFESNYIVAKEILRPRDIKAIFFVTYGFIGLRGSKAREFSQSNFYPASIIEDDDIYNAMSWDNVMWLKEQGHVIGAHTYDHPQLSNLDVDEKELQIIGSADALEKKIDQTIRYFAYPFGSISSVDKDSVALASKRFNISFSNIRGMLNESPNNAFVFRQNIVPGMPMWLVKVVVEGKLDWRYSKVRKLASNLF